MNTTAVTLAGVALALGGAFQQGCRRNGDVADLILVNGTVWTAESLSPAPRPLRSRWKGPGRVERDVRRLAGAGTRVVDLGARSPSWVHRQPRAFSRRRFSLSASGCEAASRGEFVARSPGRPLSFRKEWILNGDWDQQQLTARGRRGATGSTPSRPRIRSASTGTTATWSWRTRWP
jgi:hypothetical protein